MLEPFQLASPSAGRFPLTLSPPTFISPWETRKLWGKCRFSWSVPGRWLRCPLGTAFLRDLICFHPQTELPYSLPQNHSELFSQRLIITSDYRASELVSAVTGTLLPGPGDAVCLPLNLFQACIMTVLSLRLQHGLPQTSTGAENFLTHQKPFIYLDFRLTSQIINEV